jgi:outer membrane receptor protein involved in Fe transport
VNVFASVSSPGGGFRFRVFGKNLTDSQYFGWITAFSSGQYVGVAGGPPRHFGADVTFAF